MKGRGGSPLGLYTMGIAALFLAVFLALVMFGAQTFRDVAASQEENNNTRALLSYLSTCVKGNDSSGHISVLESEYGPLLMLGSESGYALYIYQYNGQLLEEYRAAGNPLNPENANILGGTSTFLVETPALNTLRITTDEGNVLLYLRSGEGQE